MKPHDVVALRQRFSQHSLKRGRTATDTGFASTPFVKLARFNQGGVFVGRFTGEAPWERHSYGDELVHVLSGEVTVTVMTARGPRSWHLREGSILVVPRGAWHRSHSRTEVTMLSATPTPTEISFTDPPRSNKRLEATGDKRQARRQPRSPAGRSAVR